MSEEPDDEDAQFRILAPWVYWGLAIAALVLISLVLYATLPPAP